MLQCSRSTLWRYEASHNYLDSCQWVCGKVFPILLTPLDQWALSRRQLDGAVCQTLFSIRGDKIPRLPSMLCSWSNRDRATKGWLEFSCHERPAHRVGSGGLRGEAPHPTRQPQVVSFTLSLNVFPQPRAALHCRGPVRYLNSSSCFLFTSGKESGWSDHPRPHHRHRPAGYPEVAGQVAEANNNSPHPAEPWGFPAVQPEGCAGHVAQASEIAVVHGHSFLWSETCPLGT